MDIRHFKVVAREKPPFLYITPNSSDAYSGYSIDLLNAVSKMVHFTYDLYTVPDGKVGSVDAHEGWNGMAGELQNGTADIALGPIPVLAENEYVMDYSFPIFKPTGLRFTMKQFRSDSFFTFARVIDTPIIGVIVAAFVVNMILMRIFERWSPFSSRNKSENKGKDASFSELLFYSLVSLTPHRNRKVPEHLSGRLLVANWWIFGFLLIIMYTANLSTYLTQSKMSDPITTWDDLRKQHSVKYAPLNDSDEMRQFQKLHDIELMFKRDIPKILDKHGVDAQDYTYPQKHVTFWEGIKRAEMPATVEDALARLKASTSPTDGFAFIADASDIRYLAMINCDLVEVGEEVAVKQYAFGFRKDLNITEDFNDALRELIMTSYLDRLEETWWSNSSKSMKCLNLDDGLKGVGISNIAGLFEVLIIGIVLACFVIAYEYFTYKDETKKNVVEVLPKGEDIIVQDMCETGNYLSDEFRNRKKLEN